MRTPLRWTLALLLLAPAAPVRAAPRVIEIAARRFQFTPAEIRLKVGEPVLLRVHSEDVVHGFFNRPLGIDATIEPGKVLEVALVPAAAGTYLTICDHFCGAGHGNMKMTIVVE